MSDPTALGRRKVTFPKYEKVTFLNETPDSELSELSKEFCKPIWEARDLFLKLESEKELIMQSSLGLALRYYAAALQADSERRLSDVVIDLTIAAEALFSTGSNFTRNLKDRLSKFIEEDKEARAEIGKTIGNFLRVRGLIAHGNMTKIPLKDVRTFNLYIRRGVEKALTMKLYTKEQLVASS
ncbi:MAG: HEPN domain-containing protein [Thaumarchaeota archaeon]|nr:HEPN domain-containing protein [Nitrososphaerota archaeon]